jgi:hypothetical protein
MKIPGDFSKNRRDHRVYLRSVEVSLFREQLLARATDTRLLFPGLDPAVACELGHSDGGALFFSTYRHPYEGEKRVHAARLDAWCVRAWTLLGQT